MYNVDMNVAMAKRCNMKNVFSDFNKNNVMSSCWEYGQRWGMINPQERGMPRECLRGAQGGN
jgi:hypothetical protein